jgi:hypothetical protein
MKKILLFILSVLFSVNVYTQSCTSTVYYDNMETFTWFGDWWTPALTTGFFTNASVSANISAVIYGSGNGTSAIEQDWYSLPNITGLNPAYSYQLKFRLASYTFSNSTATTRGLDVADYLSVQVSTNGGVSYVTELRITGNSNATWPYTSTGTITHTANGTFTNSAAPTGDVYQAPAGATTTGPSTITLNLQPNITQVAVDLYCRANSAGEEFWIDNVELIEIIPTPTITINGVNSVCDGTPTTLTASGANTYVWDGGISNGVSFTPTSTTSYSVTGTYNGMINGLGTRNTCSSTSSTNVVVKPIPNIPTLNPDTTICPSDFAVLYGSSNIGTLQWYDASTSGTLLGTGYSYTTSPLLNNTPFYAEAELNGCISSRAMVNVFVDPNCILPIYLATFDGHNEGRENHLYWLTEQEINSSHFEIERSNNGYDFIKIGIVETDPSKSYNFIDNSPYSGSNYYRLKMVDLDETFSYSSIIYLETKNQIESKVYPNPFEDSLIYTYESEQNEELEIQVINILGQKVFQYNVSCQTCGNYVSINTSNIPSGKYTIRIKHLSSLHETIQTMIKK